MRLTRGVHLVGTTDVRVHDPEETLPSDEEIAQIRTLARVKQRRAWIGTAMRLTVETVLIVSLLGIILLITLRGGSGADTVSLLALFAYTGFRAVPSANRIMSTRA